MGPRDLILNPLSAVLLIGALASGCGDSRLKKTYPVKGQVYYQGNPATGATVFFHPKNNPDDPWLKPSGIVDEKGFFTLTSYRAGDGVPAGPYAVTIIWLPKGYKGPIEDANQLPERYSKMETSGVTVEVKGQAENNLEPFNLHE
jgi:hypothetical protein